MFGIDCFLFASNQFSTCPSQKDVSASRILHLNLLSQKGTTAAVYQRHHLGHRGLRKQRQVKAAAAAAAAASACPCSLLSLRSCLRWYMCTSEELLTTTCVHLCCRRCCCLGTLTLLFALSSSQPVASFCCWLVTPNADRPFIFFLFLVQSVIFENKNNKFLLQWCCISDFASVCCASHYASSDRSVLLPRPLIASTDSKGKRSTTVYIRRDEFKLSDKRVPDCLKRKRFIRKWPTVDFRILTQPQVSSIFKIFFFKVHLLNKLYKQKS